MSEEPRVKLSSTYVWSVEEELPLPAQALANRERAVDPADEDGDPGYNGLFWRADCDASVIALLHSRMEHWSDTFAARAKKKGFPRESTGITSRVAAIDGDVVVVETSMRRVK